MTAWKEYFEELLNVEFKTTDSDEEEDIQE